MTSVPNLRQLLNGNKLKTMLPSVILALLVSCQVSKPIVQNSDNPKIQKEKEGKKDSVVVRRLQPKDSLYTLFPKTIKQKYVISVFLPLYFDSIDREQTRKTALTISR